MSSYRPGQAAQSLSAMTVQVDRAAPALAALARGALAAAEIASLARSVVASRAAVDRLAAARAASAAPAAAAVSVTAAPSAAQVDVPDVSSLRGALAPLEGSAARIETAFNRVGGTIVTLARRLDDAIKTPLLEQALEKTQGWLKRVSAAAKDAGDSAGKLQTRVGALAGVGEKVVSVYRGFIKVRAWLANAGDVAGKDLTQVSRLDFGRSLSGVGALKAGFSGVGRTVGGVSAGVKALGLEIAAALGVFSLAYGAVNFFKNAITGASDLNESISAAAEVFKGSFEPVQEQVDELANRFGLAKRTILDGASAFGSIAQGAGVAGADAAEFANMFTKLAGDLSSFKNISVEDAFTKLQAALSGEIEPLRRYGLVIDEAAVKEEAFRQGLAGATGELDQHAKLVARATLIQRGLAAASGDLERTGGGAANQFRRFGGSLANTAASIGQALMPAVDVAMRALNLFAASASEAFERIKPRVSEFAASVVPSAGDAIAWLADAAQVSWGYLERFGSIVVPAVAGAARFLADAFLDVATVLTTTAKAFAYAAWSAAGLVDTLTGSDLQAGAAGMLAQVESFAAWIADGPPRGAWGDQVREFFDSITAQARSAGEANGSLAETFTAIGQGAARANQKAAEQVRDLQTQISTFGASAADAAAYKLVVEGASDADVARVQALGNQLDRLEQVDEAQKTLKEAARSTIDETRTPLERYQARLKELDELRDRGLIDTETWNRASHGAFDQVRGGAGQKLAGAASLGTREAYSAIVSTSNQARPEQRMERLNEKQLTESQKQTPLLQRLVDLAAGRAPGQGLDGFVGLYGFGS